MKTKEQIQEKIDEYAKAIDELGDPMTWDLTCEELYNTGYACMHTLEWVLKDE